MKERCPVKKLVFVSSNSGKVVSVKTTASMFYGINICFCSLDFLEPEVNDISYISKTKAEYAYQELGYPCFVSDTGFYIDCYPNQPGYPGAFVKRSGVSSNLEKLLDDMKDVENRSCRFVDCITYYDGECFQQFFGESRGELATEVYGENMNDAKSELWKVFIPEGYQSTLAGLSYEEMLQYKNDKRESSATVQFLDWYRNNKLDNEKLDRKEVVGFFDWLENFTGTYSSFRDTDWLYSPDEISPLDHIQLDYLEFIYYYVEEYSKSYHIPSSSDLDINYYTVKYHDRFYSIGLGHRFGAYFGVAAKDDVSQENVLDMNRILRKSFQKKLDRG